MILTVLREQLSSFSSSTHHVRYQLHMAHLFSRQTEIINNKYSQFGNKCPGFVWHKSSGITMTLIPKQTISLKRKFVVSFYLGKINAHSYSTRLNFLSFCHLRPIKVICWWGGVGSIGIGLNNIFYLIYGIS